MSSTIMGHINLTAGTVYPFGIGQTIGAFSVQFTNAGGGTMLVGQQTTFTEVTDGGDATPVMPFSVSAVFYSSGATEDDGCSDLCLAAFPTPDSAASHYEVAYTITILDA